MPWDMFRFFDHESSTDDLMEVLALSGQSQDTVSGDMVTEAQSFDSHTGTLELLLARMAMDDPEHTEADLQALMPRFYEALSHSIVMVPTLQELDRQDGFILMTIENEAGLSGLPIFTREEALSQWITEPTQYVGIPFKNLCTKVLEQKLDFMTLNPAGAAQIELSTHELSYLAEGLIPPMATHGDPCSIVLDESAELTITNPSEPPPAMLTSVLAISR